MISILHTRQHFQTHSQVFSLAPLHAYFISWNKTKEATSDTPIDNITCKSGFRMTCNSILIQSLMSMQCMVKDATLKKALIKKQTKEIIAVTINSKIKGSAYMDTSSHMLSKLILNLASM